jgi:hypothetical protein
LDWVSRRVEAVRSWMAGRQRGEIRVRTEEISRLIGSLAGHVHVGEVR